METSTEIETSILNSFEKMIDNLADGDLDAPVDITNIQSAVDSILSEINGDPRTGFTSKRASLKLNNLGKL